jgi:hypothetical protein
MKLRKVAEGLRKVVELRMPQHADQLEERREGFFRQAKKYGHADGGVPGRAAEYQAAQRGIESQEEK